MITVTGSKLPPRLKKARRHRGGNVGERQEHDNGTCGDSEILKLQLAMGED
jgi:hypothetical protein